MRQRLLLILAFTFPAKLSHGQIIDRFGVNAGVTYSSQVWNYKLFPSEPGKEYKFGVQSFLQVEKDLGNVLAFRTELGYLQKGFKDNIELTFPDGTTSQPNNPNVILHNLALNSGLKIQPFKAGYSPYFLAGLRGDYLVSYNDIVVEEPASGMKIGLYKSTIEEFNKFNLGALFGLGIAIKDLMYFEVEYNPNITKSFNGTGLSIRDNCFGAKLGINIIKQTE